MAMMKYLVCEEPGIITLKEREPPVRKPHEALLKVHKVGICGTDLHAFQGNQAFFRYPRILGHELAAEVMEIGHHPGGIKKGDKVVVIPYISCGKCVACRMGKTNCCSEINVLGVHKDGGMQEYITVPAELLLPAPTLTLDQMAIVEPLAIAAHALVRGAVGEKDVAVVVGCGPIGIALINLARIAGARVIALDVNMERLKFARLYAGADHVILAGSDVVEEVTQITEGEKATVVFDATGQKAALEMGIQYLAHGGRYVLVGLYKGDLVFRHPEIHAREASLLCSRNATRSDFEHVLGVIGQFPTASYITHNVPYTEMIAQFGEWTKPESNVMKATIYF